MTNSDTQPTEQSHLMMRTDDGRIEKQETTTKMDATLSIWVVALFGVFTLGILFVAQLVALWAPSSEWTIDNIYGGNVSKTDSNAFFAYHQGWAWADTFFACPLQFMASYGMIRGQKWGFLLGLMAAIPPLYSSISIFVWDREEFGGRENTIVYWVFVWGQFPLLGIVEGIYCFLRLF